MDPLQKAWQDYIAICHSMVEQLKLIPGGPVPTGALPFAGAWQQFASSMGMGADVSTGQFLLPALGASREYQVIAQRMLDLSVRFQRAYAEMLQAGNEINQQALRSAHARAPPIAALHDDPIALYDAWIDGAEEAYGHVVHGEAFGRLFGELCNILSGFKVERGKLLEAFARHLDLPTRAELDSLHRQVQDLDRALRLPKPKVSSAPAKPRKTRKLAGT